MLIINLASLIESPLVIDFNNTFRDALLFLSDLFLSGTDVPQLARS